MDTKDKAYETRKMLRLEKLGSDHPVCVLCGESDWECLELHHLEGKTYGETLSVICRNCHRKLSVRQDCYPKQISTPPSLEESIGKLLLGLADFFIMLAKQLAAYGEQLLQKIKDSASVKGDMQ